MYILQKVVTASILIKKKLGNYDLVAAYPEKIVNYKPPHPHPTATHIHLFTTLTSLSKLTNNIWIYFNLYKVLKDHSYLS